MIKHGSVTHEGVTLSTAEGELGGAVKSACEVIGNIPHFVMVA